MSRVKSISKDKLCALVAKLRAGTIDGIGGCKIWVGYTQPNGYGYVNVGSSSVPAHRLALLAEGIEVPDGMDVCHTCDVRNCINHAHLYVGTRRQNMADCSARNRHNKPVGEKHWASKLTTNDVSAIRQLRAEGKTVTYLADMFGVHYSTVSRIARGIWRKEVHQ